MNSLYVRTSPLFCFFYCAFLTSLVMQGGFGAKVGSIFPEGFKLASAITATGRGWICTVKRIIESTMWVASDQRWGINDKPDDASYVRIVYGDTVRIFGCTTCTTDARPYFDSLLPLRTRCSATFLVCRCSLLRRSATPSPSSSATMCCLIHRSWSLRRRVISARCT